MKIKELAEALEAEIAELEEMIEKVSQANLADKIPNTDIIAELRKTVGSSYKPLQDILEDVLIVSSSYKPLQDLLEDTLEEVIKEINTTK